MRRSEAAPERQKKGMVEVVQGAIPIEETAAAHQLARENVALIVISIVGRNLVRADLAPALVLVPALAPAPAAFAS